jgi:hypothetical protein
LLQKYFLERKIPTWRADDNDGNTVRADGVKLGTGNEHNYVHNFLRNIICM